MSNKSRKPVLASAYDVRIIRAQFAVALGAHGLTGTLINSTDGPATFTGGGALGPSIFTLKFDTDSSGNTLAPQLYDYKFDVRCGSGSTMNGVFVAHAVTGSSLSGEYVFQLKSGSLPNAGISGPGTAVVYNESAKEAISQLTGTFIATVRGANLAV